MEDPRLLFLQHVKSKTNFQIDDVSPNWKSHTKECILATIFHIIVQYILEERKSCDIGFGHLEAEYLCPEEFIESEDPHEWIKNNSPVDDCGLVMHVYDNFYRMKQGTHRRSLMYLINMSYFDL